MMDIKKTNRRLEFRTGKLRQTIFYINVGHINEEDVRFFIENLKRGLRIPPNLMDNNED